MTKRASGKYPRNPRDSYATPYEAVGPLLAHLTEETWFDEPCQGDGHLVTHLKKHGHVIVNATDIQDGYDALEIERCDGSMFITNPPWPHPGKRGEPTLSIALHLSSIAPTWLLLSADFAHNGYFAKIAERCVKIVSVGRVSWMGNGIKGYDNAAWYLFDKNSTGAIDGPTLFYGKAA